MIPLIMKNALISIVGFFFIVGCDGNSIAKKSTEYPSKKADLHDEKYPIEGVWETVPSINVYVFGNDGSCLVFTDDDKDKIVVGRGVWKKTELKIFEGVMDTVLGGEEKDSYTYYSKDPREAGDKLIDGQVYEFADGAKFAYFRDKSSIRIENGDYATYLVKSKINQERK